MTDPKNQPSERLIISLSANELRSDAGTEEVNALIRAKAAQLVAAGKRPWFEVWYPGTTAETFDAVEVDVATGEITTLPEYGEGD